MKKIFKKISCYIDKCEKKSKLFLTWASDSEISKSMTKKVIQPGDPPNSGPLLGLSFIVYDIFPSFFTQFFSLQNLSQFLGWKLFLSWAQVWCGGGNGVARVELSWWGKEWKTSKLSREEANLAGAKRVMEFQVKRPNTTSSWGSTPKNFGQEPQTGWPRSSDP